MGNYDCSGWATKANLKCSDGRIILPDAFKHHDGQTVPLVWNHEHNDPEAVIGNALLEHRENEGMYAYLTFNDTKMGETSKLLVKHGDIDSLSIYANQLKQHMSTVMHGNIREVSLVLAGANPGAHIDNVMIHSEDGARVESDEEATIYCGEPLVLYHSDNEKGETVMDNTVETVVENTEVLEHADNSEKTVADVLKTLTDEQQTAVAYVLGKALEGNDVDDDEEDEGDEEDMKHNVFDQEEIKKNGVLSHSDEEAIIKLAKQNGGGSLKHAIQTYFESNETLAHGFVNEEGADAIAELYPEYKLVKPGAPELLERDQTWVDHVMRGVHKSPISRIRTRFADARMAELRAKGYQKKGDEKTVMGNIKLAGRTTDPQTVYIKDTMHRDDIIDITDFDVVAYKYKVMDHLMLEELAKAILIGDGREEGDPDKISPEHIRPIWTDDDLYTIHADVDIEKVRNELQGTNTNANFGENYIYAEAIIAAALYAREKYKGAGNLEFYCKPHLLNVMLLARDLNGRRIYDSKADLAAALNVKAIHTVEQFEGQTRTTADGKKKELLGLFVNLGNYQLGSTKGGEITRFSDFDIDFNTYKYLIEGRFSGAMVDLYSAIALELPVEEVAG